MIARRTLLAGLAAAPALLRAGPLTAQTSTADDLLEAARALARSPHSGAPPPLPAPFDDLTYDSYRAIRPLPGVAAELPLGPQFSVDLLPPGFYFTHPVAIEIERGGTVQSVPFSAGLFSFGPRYFGEIDGNAATDGGFSGLRLRHPLNNSDVMDEFLVMQGASYFRAIGQNMLYGLSARALALGTGGPTPEEFPRITRMRVHAPSGDDASAMAGHVGEGVVIEAVIDSPSTTAHLRMAAIPAATTVTRCELTVFPRRTIDDVGIAPLTSMFFKGPLRAAVADDFRPAVHDSDALWIENGAGEVLWRPLSNPARVETSAFLDDNPRGFGLIQVPRDFDAFEDSEAGYHRRPSAWVTPLDDWGPGAVMLVEIPTDDEFLDNIVAFWRPEAPLEPGRGHRFAYDISWSLDDPLQPDRARILQSRSGLVHDRPGALQYVIDIAPPPDSGPLTPELDVSGPAEADGLAAYQLPDGGPLRVSFKLVPGAAEAAEVRLAMRTPSGALAGPVWLHRWTPGRDGQP